MTYRLFLDDYRNPPTIGSNWVVVRSCDEAKKYVIEHGLPEFWSFDHDLSERHYCGDYSQNNTGYDFVKWLIEEYAVKQGHDISDSLALYAVHSMNPEGKARIIKLIEDYLKTCE
jgi:hypothetical protein